VPSVADLVESHLVRALTDADTYAIGVALADGGAVTFDQFGPMHVRAWVVDGERLLVDLRSGPGKLAWSCSEPGGSRGGLCCHCVAAAVETRRHAPARTSATGTQDESKGDRPRTDVETPPAHVGSTVAAQTGPLTRSPAPVQPAAFAPPVEPSAPDVPELAPAPEATLARDMVLAPELAPAPEVTFAPDAVPALDPTLAPEASLSSDRLFVPDVISPPDATPALEATPAPKATPTLGAGSISGLHAIVFTPAATEVREFFRDALGLAHVDAGNGWPIFAMPPAELAVHPADTPSQAIYLICDDLEATLASLEGRGVEVRRPVRKEAWGFVTEIVLPGGTELAIYQPTHPRPQVGPREPAA